MRGIRAKTRWYQTLYNVLGTFYPILRRLLPKYVTDNRQQRPRDDSRRGDAVFETDSVFRRHQPVVRLTR